MTEQNWSDLQPIEPLENLPTEESPEEQARIDALVAHNPAEDIINLGKLEDLDKIEPAVPTPETDNSLSQLDTASSRPASNDITEENNRASSRPASRDLIPESTPEATPETEIVTFPKSKIILMKKIAQNLRDSSAQLAELLTIISDEEVKIKTVQQPSQAHSTKEATAPMEDASVIEGLFDGEKMIGPDGKTYDVPVNYASKSRLVEGDLLKLIITPSGTFIFKQIKPVDRKRVVAVLDESETGEYYALADDRRWRLLNASVTYYKGEPGDEVVVVVPAVGSAKWGAVENIIKR